MQSVQSGIVRTNGNLSLVCVILFGHKIIINPIWTGLFANLKKLGGGGGKKALPPNLAISSQMTMKLGKDILSVEIFTNWQKFLMTSSSYWSHNIIKMRQLKK